MRCSARVDPTKMMTGCSDSLPRLRAVD